ncbi:tRNA modification GTPase, partial [Eudoraea sp.]
IVGAPNVGKSTLLNALLNEDRAIVSEVAGTTRDTIEDEITIEGIGFRFIDTAGIRKTTDIVEQIGISKTFEKMDKAAVVLVLMPANNFIANKDALYSELGLLNEKYPEKPIIAILNKIDLLNPKELDVLNSTLKEIKNRYSQTEPVLISAKSGIGIEELKVTLLSFINTGLLRNNDTVVTNSRHYNALLSALEEIKKVQEGLEEEISSDLMAIDIRQALYHLGEITGEITTDDLLGNIFANFCIGK